MIEKVLYLSVFVINIVYGTLNTRDELYKYTKISKTTDGEPCLGGCSPITKECVVDWLWRKKSCYIEKSAPIFFTAQARQKNNTQCLSNCGKFSYMFEWCITTAENDWDYCSSQVRGTVVTKRKNIIDSYTIRNKLCQSSCTYNSTFGYTCYFTKRLWDHCAKQAITRVPTLPPDFKFGPSKKTNCESFMTNLIDDRINVSPHDREYASDDYLENVAKAIEDAVKSSPETGSTIFKNDASDPVRSYTTANIVSANGRKVFVPAVIRAVITVNTIRNHDDSVDTRTSFVNGTYSWRIIGYELGGSDDTYNFALQTPRLTENLLLIEQQIKRWIRDTESSVEMLVVVFYKNQESIVPEAYGMSLTFANPKGGPIVCKDTIYWNNATLLIVLQ